MVIGCLNNVTSSYDGMRHNRGCALQMLQERGKLQSRPIKKITLQAQVLRTSPAAEAYICCDSRPIATNRPRYFNNASEVFIHIIGYMSIIRLL